MNNRYALGLRLDPLIMASDGEDPRETPYGVIFSHGRRFDGYHVRFRDIARGGMRLVTPTSPEQFALESAHQYDECYGLAYAQQLKNKDIPEGGSKAVVLIDTVGMSTSGRDFVMRKSVKAFVDTKNNMRCRFLKNANTFHLFVCFRAPHIPYLDTGSLFFVHNLFHIFP